MHKKEIENNNIKMGLIKMLENTYKLTIAIPTYNRAVYLKQCLNSIIPQIQDGIEILISDNASIDNTEEVVRPYLSMPFIKYNKNIKNLGPDGNFLKCLNIAKGEYVHIMSDDDLMCPDSIKTIIDFIQRNKPDLVILNSYTFTGRNLNKITKANININQDIITTQKDNILKKVGVWITFLSGLIFKKENYNKVKNPEKYLNTYFLQSHIALITTYGNKNIGVVKKKCIACRGGNLGGYRLYPVWIHEYKKLLFHTAIAAGYDKNLIKDLYISSLNNHICNLILYSRLNKTELDTSQKYILLKETFIYPSVWVKVYPIAFLPKQFVKLIYKYR